MRRAVRWTVQIVAVALVVGLALVAGISGAQAAMTATLAGQVTTPSGDGADDVDVEIYRELEPGVWDWYTDVSIWDGTGNWSVPVEPGSYKIAVSSSDADYDHQWYDGAWTMSEADIVTVVDGEDRADLDLQLGNDPSRGEVSGSVTDAEGSPVEHTDVTIFREDGELGWTGHAYVTTDTDGTWSVRLHPGTYRIGFSLETGDEWARPGSPMPTR